MMRIFQCTIPIALLFISTAWEVRAQATEEISYQGFLTDATDAPVTGTVDLTFSLYGAASGGTALWTETHSGVTASQGRFEVLLGSTQSLSPLDFAEALYVGTSVNGGAEMTPRMKLGGVPKALSLRGMRVQRPPSLPDRVSLVGGHEANSIGVDVKGGVIGGGGSPTNPNSVAGNFATITGGWGNSAAGLSASIGGGYQNDARGTYSTISGGNNNQTQGTASIVAGGSNNKALGGASFAAGKNASAAHHRTFVWNGTFADFASTDNEQFLIQAPGGVGIGTNAPSAALTVNGSLSFSNQTVAEDALANPLIYMFESGGGHPPRGIVVHHPNAPHIGIFYHDDGFRSRFHFQSSHSGRPSMTVGLFSRKVGIGTDDPTTTLDVRGGSFSIPVARFRNFTDSYNSSISIDAASDKEAILSFEDDGLPFWDIANVGAVLRLRYQGRSGADRTVAEATYSSFRPGIDDAIYLGYSGHRWKYIYAVNETIITSDRRLKRDIIELDYGLREILRLRPVSFTWKKNPGEGRHLGLIAQEALGVTPEAVDVPEDPDAPLGLQYGELIPVLIKSIQELKQIIDEQEDEIARQGEAIVAMRALLGSAGDTASASHD